MDLGIRKAFRTAEQYLARTGYVTRWLPPSIATNTKVQIRPDFECLCAHLMLAKPSPKFLEIGANDGITVDPIWPFVQQYGWQGVMVEPQPGTYQKLLANYRTQPQVQCINVAIGREDGAMTLYTAKTEEHDGTASLFASFDRNVVLRHAHWIPDIADRIEEVTVTVWSFATLVKETGLYDVDILQIDAEGYDAEILAGVDFNLVNPALIQYEHAHLSKSQMEFCAKLLINQGYKLAMDDLDTIAYRPIKSLGWR